MLGKLLATALLVAVSPIGDAVNGFLKAPEGSCKAIAVLGPDRMAFLCSDGIALGRIMDRPVPSLTRPHCAAEALHGLQAVVALKYSLYAAGDVRTYGFHRIGDAFYIDMLIDLETVEQAYRSTMPTLLDVPPQDLCRA